MVKISCPKCEAKKSFTFFLIGRGNVSGANMNLSHTGFISILREINGEIIRWGSFWNQAVRTFH